MVSKTLPKLRDALQCRQGKCAKSRLYTLFASVSVTPRRLLCICVQALASYILCACDPCCILLHIDLQ